MDQRVLKVIALMKESLHRGWSAGGAARCVNLSPSRLHQVFKEETGLPPARYLRLLRMQRARELLETSYLSVKQVMARVGVTDESHFVRDFKKTCGLTPAQYRERFLGGLLDESPPPQPPQLNHVAAPSAPRPSPARPSPAPSAVGVTAPPLLLRRPSHPQQLRPDNSLIAGVRKRAELLSLLVLRHTAFAELTTAVTDNIVREQNGFRPISYRPRRSSTARRLPPVAGSPRSLPTRPTRRSLDPPLLPSALHTRRKA